MWAAAEAAGDLRGASESRDARSAVPGEAMGVLPILQIVVDGDGPPTHQPPPTSDAALHWFIGRAIWSGAASSGRGPNVTHPATPALSSRRWSSAATYR